MQGLGVVIQDAKEGGLVITQVFQDGPAFDINLQVGDIITHVDDISIKNKSLKYSIGLIKGPVSKISTLTINRSGKIMHKEFRRRQISVDSIPTISNEIKDGILWIKIRSFKSFTANSFAEILNKNIDKNIKGIIIDLRYNGGGLMESAQKMLGEILPENSVAVRLYTRENEIIYRVKGSGNFINIPIVVFQNEYSASASEIFSAAIKDYERGKIIGTTSYGKGVAQSIFSLKRGSLKLTIAEFKSPLQNIIHKEGVIPDIKMEKFDNISYFIEAKKYLNK
jgi:carboxyl-terminal processing protease